MPDTNQHRILIADDREENRYVIRRVLEGSGFECMEADTGHDALELARSLPDLMILDVHLPDISGYEVCRTIKNDGVTSSISVLQISASFVSSEDRVRALDAGADGYLTHPIDRMVLVATVRALLRLRVAESSARKAAEQWESTFNALSEGLAVIDSENRFVRWNDAFTKAFHTDEVPQVGSDAGPFLQHVLDTEDLLGSNDRFRREVALDSRTLQVSLSPVHAANGKNDRILVISDATDRILAEYALRTAEKLAATGKLANAIAHEINNPLEALTNLVYLARHSDHVESIQGFLSAANEELERIARITRQTLAFHRDTQYPVVVDVANLVGDVIQLYEKSASTKRVRLVYERGHGLKTQGFPGQLSQVIANLVRNATEAAPPDSEVVVRVRSIFRRQKPGIRISIHDRGPGIPQDVKKKLFDPFFTTKELKGSGLGLWVSRNLIAKHKGTIRFRSCQRAGLHGTTFEVYLPTEDVSDRDGTASESWQTSASTS